MTGYPSISICVPALNEEKSLRQAVEDLISTLSAHIHSLEIIIVDDGSTDSTPHLAEQLAREYTQVKVIHHSKNLGIGVCYRDALAIAKSDYFSWFPADYENSAEEFIRCLPYLDKEDTVLTCYHRGQDPRPIMRRLISYLYTWTLNKYFNLNLRYYNGLTIFPTSLLRAIPLVANGFVFSSESIVYAVKCGYRIIELSVPLRKRNIGKSKAFTFVSIYQALIDLFRIVRIKK